MKILPAISLLGLLAFGNSIAADHSVAVAPGGINVYSITDKAVHLVAGSPFTISQTGFTAVRATINPQRNFVYAVFGTPGVSGNPLIVVGFSVTAAGQLVEKWSYTSGNVDQEIFGQNLISIVAGTNYTVFTYTPDDTTPICATVLNQFGQEVFGYCGQWGPYPPVLMTVTSSEHLLYFCEYIGPPSTPTETVSVYALPNGVFNGTASYPFPYPTLVSTSSDPEFVQSVCLYPAPLSTPP